MANYPANKDRPSPKAVKKALAENDMKALEKALSLRQRRFAEEYVIDYNGRQAALRAGYSPTGNIDNQTYILMHHEGVMAYAAHLTRERAGSVFSVNPEYVLRKVVDIVDKSSKDSDRLRALELLAKHLGMLVDRTEISGPDGGAIETRVSEDADAFSEQLKQLADRAKEAKKVVVELV